MTLTRIDLHTHSPFILTIDRRRTKDQNERQTT